MKPGDIVKCIDVIQDDVRFNDITVGKSYGIESLTDSILFIHNDKGHTCTYPAELFKLESTTKRCENPTEFKVGDTVEYLGGGICNGLVIGEHYTIKSVQCDFISIDGPFGYHGDFPVSFFKKVEVETKETVQALKLRDGIYSFSEVVGEVHTICSIINNKVMRITNRDKYNTNEWELDRLNEWELDRCGYVLLYELPKQIKDIPDGKVFQTEGVDHVKFGGKLYVESKRSQEEFIK